MLKKKRWKQLLAMCLSVALIFTALPEIPVYAADADFAAELEDSASEEDTEEAVLQDTSEDVALSSKEEAAAEEEELSLQEEILTEDAAEEEIINLKEESEEGQLVVLNWLEDQWDGDTYIGTAANVEATWLTDSDAIMGYNEVFFGWYTGTAFTESGNGIVVAKDSNVANRSYQDIAADITVTYAEEEGAEFYSPEKPDEYYSLKQAVAYSQDEEVEKENVTEINFFRSGVYRFTYQNTSVDIRVGYQLLDAFNNSVMNDDYYLFRSFTYSGNDCFFLENTDQDNFDIVLGKEQMKEEITYTCYVFYDTEEDLPVPEDMFLVEKMDNIKDTWKVTVSADAIKETDLRVKFPYTATSNNVGEGEEPEVITDYLYCELHYMPDGFVINYAEDYWDGDNYISSYPGNKQWAKYLSATLPGGDFYFGDLGGDSGIVWHNYSVEELTEEGALSVSFNSGAEELKDITGNSDYYEMSPSVFSYWDQTQEKEIEITRENVVHLDFYKAGIYTFSYKGEVVTMEVGYPELAAYSKNSLADEYFCGNEITYETDFEFYLLPDSDRKVELGASEVWDRPVPSDAWVVYDADPFTAVEEDIIQIKVLDAGGYQVSVSTNLITEENLHILFPYTVYRENGETIDYTGGVGLTLKMNPATGLMFSWDSYDNGEEIQTEKTMHQRVNEVRHVFLYTRDGEDYVPVTDVTELIYDAKLLKVEEVTEGDYTTAKDGFVKITYLQPGTATLAKDGMESGIRIVIKEPIFEAFYDEAMTKPLEVWDDCYHWDFHEDTVYVKLGNDSENVTSMREFRYPQGVSAEVSENNVYKFKIESYLALGIYEDICIGANFGQDENQWYESCNIHFTTEGEGTCDRTQYEYGREGTNYSGCYLYTESWYDPYIEEEVTFSEYEQNMSWNPMPSREVANQYPIYWFNADTLQGVINQMNGSISENVTFHYTSSGLDDYTKRIADINTGECMIQPSATDFVTLPEEYIYNGAGFDRIRVRFSVNKATTNASYEDEDGNICFVGNSVYRIDDTAASMLNEIIGEEKVTSGDYIEFPKYYPNSEIAEEMEDPNLCIYLATELESSEDPDKKPYRFERGEMIIDTLTLLEKQDVIDIYGENKDSIISYLQTNEMQMMIVTSYPTLHINADCEYHFSGWFNNPVYFAMGTNTDYTFNVTNYVPAKDEEGNDVYKEQLITYRYSDLKNGNDELPKYITVDFCDENGKQYTSIENPIILTEQLVSMNSVSGSYIEKVGELAKGESLITISQDSLPDISGQEEVTMSEEQMKALEEDGASMKVDFDVNSMDPADESLSAGAKKDIASINAAVQSINKDISVSANQFKTAEILDMNVLASVIDKDGKTIGFDPERNNINKDGSVNIHEFYKPFRMSIKLPKEYLGEALSYKVICVHDGKTYVLEASYKNGYLTFEADRFSTYAICYSGSRASDHVHKPVSVNAVEATCTVSGNIAYYKCSECGKLFADKEMTKEISLADTVVNATGHKHVSVNAVEATCSVSGNIAYHKCTICGKLFADEEMTKEITLADTVIAPIGHDWDEGKVTKEPTAKEEGVLTHTCKNDPSHTYTEAIEKIKQPTIDATGTVQADGSIKFDIKDLPKDLVYTGTAPTVNTKLQVPDASGNNITLAEGTDYKITYKNSKTAGTMTVVITGLGEYKKLIYQETLVTIAPRDITSAEESGITAADLVFKESQKGKAKAKPVVYYNGKKLKLNKDYELYVGGVKYDGKTTLDPSVSKLTIKGVGNYTGSQEIAIIYLAGDDTRYQLSKAKVKGIKAQSYTGSSINIDNLIKAGLTTGKTTLKEGEDYTISYAGNVNVGVAYAIISAVSTSDKCVGSKVIPFKISGTALSKSVVTLTYQNKTISTKKGETVQVLSPATTVEPEVTVMLNGKTLVEGIDYKVSMTKNRKPGTASVMITGLNGYTGKKTAKFKISK